MNAVMRPKREVPVLTNEAIEVHLASLRAGQDELREDVRELRADNKSLREKVDVVQATLSQDIKALDRKMNDKFDAVDRKFDAIDRKFDAVDRKVDGRFDAADSKIDSRFSALDAKNDSLNSKIDAVNANLSEKLTQLSNAVASMRGLQKATLWLMSILGSLGTVGKILHWF